MPSRKIPNTTPSVIRCLSTARDAWKNTPAPDRAISADQWAQLDDSNENSLLSRMLKQISDVEIALAAQAPLTSGLAQTAARLTMFVSQFHQVLDFGITRGAYKPGARSYYGRDINASTIPDLTNYDAVQQAAQHIVDGEAARDVAENSAFVAMTSPSAAEVGAVLAQFKTLRSQSIQAQTQTDREREDVSTLYPEAQALAEDICDTVEFFYRKDPDASSRRAKAGRWGVVYIFDVNEPGAPPAPSAPAESDGHSAAPMPVA
jgi:hypothetical protein